MFLCLILNCSCAPSPVIESSPKVVNSLDDELGSVEVYNENEDHRREGRFLKDIFQSIPPFNSYYPNPYYYSG